MYNFAGNLRLIWSSDAALHLSNTAGKCILIQIDTKNSINAPREYQNIIWQSVVNPSWPGILKNACTSRWVKFCCIWGAGTYDQQASTDAVANKCNAVLFSSSFCVHLPMTGGVSLGGYGPHWSLNTAAFEQSIVVTPLANRVIGQRQHWIQK